MCCLFVHFLDFIVLSYSNEIVVIVYLCVVCLCIFIRLMCHCDEIVVIVYLMCCLFDHLIRLTSW
jgi:hypothetical protein